MSPKLGSPSGLSRTATGGHREAARQPHEVAQDPAGAGPGSYQPRPRLTTVCVRPSLSTDQVERNRARRSQSHKEKTHHAQDHPRPRGCRRDRHPARGRWHRHRGARPRHPPRRPATWRGAWTSATPTSAPSPGPPRSAPTPRPVESMARSSGEAVRRQMAWGRAHKATTTIDTRRRWRTTRSR